MNRNLLVVIFVSQGKMECANSTVIKAGCDVLLFGNDEYAFIISIIIIIIYLFIYLFVIVLRCKLAT